MEAPARTAAPTPDRRDDRRDERRDDRRDEQRADSDWGLAPAKPGFSRENKFILFILLVLVTVFSYVVFRNFQKKQASPAGEQVAGAEGKGDGKTGAKTAEKGGEKGAGRSGKSHGAKTHAANGHAGEEAEATITLGADNPPEQDPFNEGAAPSQSAPVANENVVDDPAEVATAETELNSENVAAPVQIADTPDAIETSHATRPRGAANHGTDSQVAETHEAETHGTEPQSTEPQGAELFGHEAEATATATTHRRGRGQHSNRAPMQELPAQPADEGMEFPVETALEQTPMEEVPSDLTQVGGETNLQPIRQKGAGARGKSNRLEVAQNSPPLDSTNGGDFLTPTTPRAANPANKTAPRAATQPRNNTQPRTTQPRTNTLPPPPLDPKDPRLGGYREAELMPTEGTTHIAGRNPAVTSAGQFDPQNEPLIGNAGEYVVRPNDNYWRISRKIYGTARYFAALAKHNEAAVPDTKHMKPGIKISTPTKEQLEQSYGNLVPAAAHSHPAGAVINPPHAPKTPGYFVEPDGQPAYRVGSSDNLSSISQKTLGRSSRWDEIFELNRDRLAGADNLPIGAILRLPADASQTRVVSKPIENR